VEEIFLPVIECTIHGVNDIRQTEIHTAGPQVPELSAFEVELAIESKKITNQQVSTKYQQNELS